MDKLNLFDIQGFVARGYNFPHACYLLAEILTETEGREFVCRVVDHVTSAAPWERTKKPSSTVNVGFTWQGLMKLGLPDATLISFPVEFCQGMRGRNVVLGDVGPNDPSHWEPVWQGDNIHVWLSINALTPEELERRTAEIERLMDETQGARLLDKQQAASICIDGQRSGKEHFGYTDGFGNPDFAGVERSSAPGQGKLTPDGKWAPLATGEFLLGYPDEAQELPDCPVPYLLGINGTYMAYRKLHQNVASFRDYLTKMGEQYPGGREKLAAKFVGRWRDGTPLEGSPDAPDQDLVKDPQRNTNFTYGGDLNGARCPIGAHIRRTNPRDAFGFNGELVNRRRIMRRGMPYGAYTPEDQPARDDDDHGIVFMALCASLFRQFEFVQQQWIEYGNDARLGNDTDPLIGCHGNGHEKFMVQGAAGDPQNAPFVCGKLPNFVAMRGGAYFFLPSLTALRLIATGSVDPR
jgi:Dyp-type peroxidase family